MNNTKIKFKTLTMRNFMSYGNNITIFNFETNGTTLIIGEDLDNTSNGKGGNGCGKTTIINALTYCIFDKPISNISKDNLVNNINNKQMIITLDFSKGTDEYRIERARKMKTGAAGNFVVFKKLGPDGEYIDLSRDSKNTNTLIEKVIGISYDLFCQIIIFSATKTPFLDLPVRHPQLTNQTEIIETLFGLTILSDKAELIKKQTKDRIPQLEKLENRLELIEREHKRHQDQIISAKNRVTKWNIDNQALIEKHKKDLKSIEEVDLDKERTLHDTINELTNNKQKITLNITETNRVLKDKNKNKTTYEQELSHLKDKKCPYCLQEYKDTQSKIDILEEKLKNAILDIDLLNEKYDNLGVELEQIVEGISEIKSKITTTNIEELINIKAQSNQISNKIIELENAINPFVEPLEELEQIQLEPIDYSEINKLKQLIEHEKFLVKLLTKQDSFVRKVLLNKNLPFLNKRLAKYINELSLPHKVEFNTELVAEISRFGRPLDFGNLSNGQRARVNIALSFAFRDVLQKLHNPINVCLLDEVLDIGLDSIGIQSAAKMIKRLARDEQNGVYIISHREELESVFDKTLTIQMSKGFSYIKEET